MLRIIVAFLIVYISVCNVWAQAPLKNKTVSPQQGEGIYSLLRRCDLSPAKYLEEFMALNEGKFGKDNSLLMHHSYILPISNTVYDMPLFGEERREVKVESEDLIGTEYFLVAGHGGPDPGALGKYGKNTLSEDEYAYDITLRLAKRLIECGAKVQMVIQDENDGIRDRSHLLIDDDETCNGKVIPLIQKDRLKQRADEVNRLYKASKSSYRRCIVIHLDSRSQRQNIDVFFYHHSKSKEGKKMANSFYSTFEEKYSKHQPNRGYEGTISTRGLYMLKKTLPTTVFIELGNIRNFRDQQRFILESNRQALANWLCEGAIADFKRWSGN